MIDLTDSSFLLPSERPLVMPRSIRLPAAITSNLAALFQYAVILAILGYGLYRGATAMPYEWQWSRVVPFLFEFTDGGFRWGPISLGLVETIHISFLAAALTVILGLMIATMRLSASWSARVVSRGYIELIRNTPLIVQISMFYFVLAPIFGIGRFWTGVLCLAIFEASFVSEIIRAGILAVPLGQWEAGASLGLSRFNIYRKIILPQALRIMSPPLTGAGISLIKDSSIVSVIALFELTTAGRDVISTTFMSFEIWLTVAAIYLALTVILSLAAQFMERRMRRRL